MNARSIYEGGATIEACAARQFCSFLGVIKTATFIRSIYFESMSSPTRTALAARIQQNENYVAFLGIAVL